MTNPPRTLVEAAYMMASNAGSEPAPLSKERYDSLVKALSDGAKALGEAAAEITRLRAENAWLKARIVARSRREKDTKQ